MSRGLLSGLVRSDLIADGAVSEGGRSKMVGGVLEPVRSWVSILSLCLVLCARRRAR